MKHLFPLPSPGKTIPLKDSPLVAYRRAFGFTIQRNGIQVGVYHRTGCEIEKSRPLPAHDAGLGTHGHDFVVRACKIK